MAPMDNRFLCPRSKGDPDALAYIEAVQQADGESLEQSVKTAIEAFVIGCKADSAGYAGDPTRTVWDAIKASCLLCGPRTLAGALVPLRGDAPTASAFTSGDYDRVTGLKSDGATTYLDSNRANDADGQNDNHLAVYATAVATTYASMQISGGEYRSLYQQTYRLLGRANSSTLTIVDPGNVVGFMGVTRSNSTSQTARAAGTSVIGSAASQTPSTLPVLVFRNPTGGAQFSDARLAFYSIGSALSLESLDTRISAYVAAIAAAL